MVTKMAWPDKVKIWELYYLQETPIDRVRQTIKWESTVTPSWSTVKRITDDFLILTPAQMGQLPDALQARWRELQPRRLDKGQEPTSEDLLRSTAKETFKAQLFTLAPEDILIDDLGSLGDHSACLKQDTLSVVLHNLGYAVGFKAAVTATTWAVPRPREVEIFWRVKTAFSGLIIERYCPAEHDPLFHDWLASAPSTLKQDITEWKRSGGSYLAHAVSTRMKIHDAAKQRTDAWVGDSFRDLLSLLPGELQRMAPLPLTVNFGNLIYQLAIEYCRTEGVSGLPDEACYNTIPGDRPPWVQLVLEPKIPLGNTLPGLVQSWVEAHRKMIVEWGKSKDIGSLLNLFKRLDGIEKAIKQGLMMNYPA